MHVEKVKVSLDFGSSPIEVGTLLRQDQLIYFRYATSFLDNQLNISPFKLKKTSEIITCPKEPFEGLPGVFNDSIPDGWGRLLLDRKLLSQGIDPTKMGSMERLSYIGRHAQGALIYEPYAEDEEFKECAFDLDHIANETEILQKTGAATLLDDLYHLGGNSVGARPKILINYDESSNSFSRTHDANFEPWIIKFTALTDLKDIAKIEYIYALMARDSGIEMHPTKLFITDKGHSYFGTKRFDFQNGKRVHLHSASGLMHDNFRLSTMDYGHLMDAANRLENNLSACVKVFRLAVFNVCSLNMDDHSKNVAFLMNQNGNWQFAPAYDLTYSPKQGGYHSLSVANQHKEPGRKELLKLADHFNVDRAVDIIDHVKEAISNFDNYAKAFEVNSVERQLIKKALDAKLSEI